MRKSELKTGMRVAYTRYRRQNSLPSAREAEVQAINPSRDEIEEAMGELSYREHKELSKQNVTLVLFELIASDKENSFVLGTSRHAYSEWDEYEEQRRQRDERRKARKEARERSRERSEELKARIEELLDEDAGFISEYRLGKGLGLNTLERLVEMAEAE